MALRRGRAAADHVPRARGWTTRRGPRRPLTCHGSPTMAAAVRAAASAQSDARPTRCSGGRRGCRRPSRIAGTMNGSTEHWRRPTPRWHWHPRRERHHAEHGYRHSPRRHSFAVAGQRGPDGPRRAFCRGLADEQRQHLPTDQAAQSRAAQLSDRALCGRFRGVGGRDAGARGSPAGGSGDGNRTDGLAPVGGENEGLPH